MIKLLKPIGHCFGVINAIKLAKEVANANKDKNIYVFGLLVHNEEVVEELQKEGIITIDLTNKDPLEELNKFNQDDIVIFTAHGHPYIYEQILKEKGIHYFDATCPKVSECFNRIKEAKETIYIGKKNHPEANAALTMNEDVYLYDINDKFDYALLKSDHPLVINQTTLSFLELEDIHQEIKNKLPHAYINDEICDATLLRQKAIKNLDQDIDTLIIVGSKRSSNTMKLYEIAKALHVDKEIILVNNVNDLKEYHLNNKNIALSSGTSTSIKVINEIKDYLASL